MAIPQVINISPLAVAENTGSLNMATKKIVILLRWPVVIVCVYLLLYSSGEEFESAPVHVLIPLYLLSNVALNYVHQRFFESPYFYVPLVIFDILFLTASLILSGQTGTDFYLAYFSVIMLAALIQDFRGSVAVAILAPFIYGYFLFANTEVFDSAVFLRIPFLFLVAIFCGYFTQLARTERVSSLARNSQVKSELLNIVSHELRTPLSVIIGSAWVLKEKKLGEMNAQQEKTVDMVMKNSKELLELLNTILEAYKLGTSPLRVDREEIDLGAFLDGLKLYYGMAPAKETTVTWDYPSDLPVVKTDKMKLKVILQNLINNGTKFTESGTVTVSARHIPSAERIEFRVSDTGRGIPKESLPNIFEMFYQADKSMTRSQSGVGLGLYIVKSFAEMLGGTVAVESEPNRGSTFIVCIPHRWSAKDKGQKALEFDRLCFSEEILRG